MDKTFDTAEALLHHPEDIDLLPASIELSGMEVSLVNAMSRETILRQVLEPFKKQYDYILIDCIAYPNPDKMNRESMQGDASLFMAVWIAFGFRCQP